MDPLTLMMIAMAAGPLIQGGLQAKSALDAGDEALSAAKKNARNIRRQAGDVTAIGSQEAGAIRTEATKIIGEQRAAGGASGVAVGSGSAVELAAYTRQQAELDALRTKNNAAREAWGMRTQAAEVLRQGKLEKKQSRINAVGAIMGGVSGAVSAGAGAYGKGG